MAPGGKCSLFRHFLQRHGKFSSMDPGLFPFFAFLLFSWWVSSLLWASLQLEDPAGRKGYHVGPGGREGVRSILYLKPLCWEEHPWLKDDKNCRLVTFLNRPRSLLLNNWIFWLWENMSNLSKSQASTSSTLWFGTIKLNYLKSLKLDSCGSHTSNQGWNWG